MKTSEIDVRASDMYINIFHDQRQPKQSFFGKHKTHHDLSNHDKLCPNLERNERKVNDIEK